MARRISVSMLSSYTYCKRKLFLQYVLNLVEPEKEAMVKGSIRHETYDKINKIEENIVKSITSDDNLKTLYTKYLNVYSQLLRKTINVSKAVPEWVGVIFCRSC
jgi:CRISPR/Cas system-associated exonuclease Cas4 (RecB family)